jgi:hypothetical protein
MSYGFEVRNSQGQVVLDSESINIVSDSNQNFTTNSVGLFSHPVNLSSFLVPLENNQMLTACQPAGNGLRTFRLRSGTGDSLPPVLADTTIPTRKVIAFNEASPPTGFGMVIKNSEGETVFHTNQSLLSVLSVQRLTLPASQTSLSVAIPSQATHFLVNANFRQFIPTVPPQNTLVITVGFQRLTSTTGRIISDRWGVLPLGIESGPVDCTATIVAARIV